MENFNLIENYSVKVLSNEYNNKLINKIKEEFTTEEQKIFIVSFLHF